MLHYVEGVFFPFRVAFQICHYRRAFFLNYMPVIVHHMIWTGQAQIAVASVEAQLFQ